MQETVLIRPTQADTARATIEVLRELKLERRHDQFGNRREILMMLQNLTHKHSVNIHIIRLLPGISNS
jgi:hypothetical protein